MKKKTRNYEVDLINSLKNPKEAAAYLNTHLEDNEEGAEELFLLALRDVALAHGIEKIADVAELGRESLYKSLSANGNPKFHTMRAILSAMGLRLHIETEDEKEAS
jgi:probable addiction module antidote protein